MTKDAKPFDIKAEKQFDVTYAAVFSVAIPMMFAYLTTPLLSMVDTVVVGRLGEADLLGGLAIASIVFSLLFGTFNFLRSATTGLVAQASGRKDAVAQQAIVIRSLLIALVSGVVMIILTPFILHVSLWAMAPSAAVADAASIYFNIRMLSAPFALTNYALLGFLLGKGLGRHGLLLQLIINGANIILSVVLGLGIGWGIEGVAIATIISETLGCLAGILMLVPHVPKTYRPTIGQIVNLTAVKQLMALNGDIMIRSFVLTASFAWFTRIGAQMGDNILAANAILLNVFLVFGYILDGFATAAEQLAGRAIGAKDKIAFVKTIKRTGVAGGVFAFVLTSISIFIIPPLVDFVTTSPEVRALGREVYILASLTAITGVLAFQMDGVFIGATWSGDMRNMMIISLLIFVVITLVLVPISGNLGLWIALNIFLLARGVLLMMMTPSRIDRAFPSANFIE